MTSQRTILFPPDSLLPDGAKPGGWWHDADDGRMICDLCPRECNLKPGDRGFCFVRQNRDGQMVLTTYGKSTGFCIDPIEKKPLNHFLPGTSVLSFGTAGCNLGCKFCQNHDISKARKVELLSSEAMPETIANAAVELGCASVAYTYNDPIIWAEYAIDTAKACRQRGIKSVAVTAGYITEKARQPFFEFFDAANVDLKAFTEEFYYQLTLSHIQPVLDTLAWLKRETDVWFEITNLIIPDANDSDDELKQMCDWVLEHVGDEVPVHFTAFHPDFKMMDRPRTPHETLLRGYEVARAVGIKFAYVGNVHDVEHQSTYCPSCRKLLIERDWHQLGRYHMDESSCGHCGQSIPGRFQKQPGTWGRKRQPVDLTPYAVSTTNPTQSQLHPPPAQQVPGEGRAESEGRVGRTTESPYEENRTEPSPLVPRDPPRIRSSLAKGRVAADVSSADIDKVNPNTPVTHQIQVSPTMATNTSTTTLTLTDEQGQQVFRAACEMVAATLNKRQPALAPEFESVAKLPIDGAFVSLKRKGRLRGCCGFVGQKATIASAIAHAAKRTALEDPRLPPVSPTELPHLDCEVWLLQPPTRIHARGENRVAEIQIGRDGLVISRGNQRGLLLPGVATDLGLDAKGFLKQVCLKAKLSPEAWKQDDTILQKFAGHCVGGRFDAAVSQSSSTPPPILTDEEFRVMVDFCRDNVILLGQGAVASCYINGVSDGMVNGITLSIRRQNGSPAHLTRLSLRPPMPLQSTLYSLSENAAKLLAAQNVPAHQCQFDLTIFTDPAMHGTVSQPDLAGFDPATRALLGNSGSNRSVWKYDAAGNADDLLASVTTSLELPKRQDAALYSLATLCSANSLEYVNVPRPQAGPQVRPPALAGKFYPADADELQRTIDGMVPAQPVERKPWRAVMVPHAGLQFSGRIAGETLARVEIPDTVIVIGPKHTPAGMNHAIAPHVTWSLPGIAIASDIELAQTLAQTIPDLQLDAAAHQNEHGIEVVLPFLHRFASQSRVVGIALGRGEWELCERIGEGLAQVIGARDNRILLVISSDMNHFAEDAENRRRDEIAMESLEGLNPQTILETVRKNEISMCGVIPACAILHGLSKLAPLKTAERVAYATSADVSGDKSRVVGYCGMLFE